MKIIPLTREMVTVVDDNDYAELSIYKWYAHTHGSNKRLYAARNSVENGKRVTVLMHRELLKPPDGFEVDHADGDSLDNRRANIRICTRSQNIINRPCKRKHGQYRGTHFMKHGTPSKKWEARITRSGESMSLGYFSSAQEAAIAHDAAAKKIHGEFAWLNFPDDADKTATRG